MDNDHKDLPALLTEHARRCHKRDWQTALKEVAVDVSTAIDAVARNRSYASVRSLNNAIAHANAVLSAAPVEVDPQPPMAGAPEAALLAA